MVLVRGEDDMVVMKSWSMRSFKESVWWDTGLIGLSGGVIFWVERQCDPWLYVSASIIMCTCLGR